MSGITLRPSTLHRANIILTMTQSLSLRLHRSVAKDPSVHEVEQQLTRELEIGVELREPLGPVEPVETTSDADVRLQRGLGDSRLPALERDAERLPSTVGAWPETEDQHWQPRKEDKRIVKELAPTPGGKAFHQNIDLNAPRTTRSGNRAERAQLVLEDKGPWMPIVLAYLALDDSISKSYKDGLTSPDRQQ
jgi:hypothetical protein